MAKNKNMRKYAAVALGILGVAGLSLAAASQLTVTTDEIAVGADSFSSCDETGINVAYTTGAFSIPNLAVDEIVVGTGTADSTIVDAACQGKTYTVSVLDQFSQPISTQTYSDEIDLTDGSFTVETVGLTANAIHGVLLVIK